MKSIGLVRNVDNLGRIVLPAELRVQLGIPVKCPLEVYIDNKIIIFKKYQPGCIFCGDVTDIAKYKGKSICPTCLAEIKTYK